MYPSIASQNQFLLAYVSPIYAPVVGHDDQFWSYGGCAQTTQRSFTNLELNQLLQAPSQQHHMLLLPAINCEQIFRRANVCNVQNRTEKVIKVSGVGWVDCRRHKDKLPITCERHQMYKRLDNFMLRGRDWCVILHAAEKLLCETQDQSSLGEKTRRLCRRFQSANYKQNDTQ